MEDCSSEIINIKNISKQEALKILTKELIKIKNEISISELVYSYHDCDSYEDLFRDNIPLLKVKKQGIEIAIENLKKLMKF
jgi:hypothetical protein